MGKILVSLPDDLVMRMRAVIPARHRSKLITDLLKKELERKEQELYECACEVEKDDKLNQEMADWEVTVGDGIESEPR